MTSSVKHHQHHHAPASSVTRRKILVFQVVSTLSIHSSASRLPTGQLLPQQQSFCYCSSSLPDNSPYAALSLQMPEDGTRGRTADDGWTQLIKWQRHLDGNMLPSVSLVKPSSVVQECISTSRHHTGMNTFVYSHTRLRSRLQQPVRQLLLPG